MSFRMSSASSGMGVADDCKHAFLELKRKKIHRYVVFKIDEKTKQVIVEKTGGPAESYDDFTAALPENDCRYAVYDFDFVTHENCQKSKIFFIAWSFMKPPSTGHKFMCSFYKRVQLAFSEAYINQAEVHVSFLQKGTGSKKFQRSVKFAFLVTTGGKGTFASLLRCPDVSKIRAKMLYATTKDRLKRELDGFHYEVQATDPAEIDIEVIRDRAN